MLFPITDAYETMRKAQDADVEANGVSGVESIIFIRQTISNACGTFALLHALANAGIPLQDDSPLHKLFEDCIDKSPLERAKLIEVSGDIERVHEATAVDGQTPVRSSLCLCGGADEDLDSRTRRRCRSSFRLLRRAQRFSHRARRSKELTYQSRSDQSRPPRGKSFFFPELTCLIGLTRIGYG